MNPEKLGAVQKFRHWRHVRACEREWTERHRPLRQDQRIEATRKVLRFVEDNEDSLKQVDLSVEQEHRQKGQQRKQSAFAAQQFVFGEDGYFPEQVAPVLATMLEHGLIDRSENFTVLQLTEDGRYLLEQYDKAIADPEFRRKLPWFEEGWEG